MSKCGEAWDGGKEWSPAVINSGAGFEVHQFIFIGFNVQPFQEFPLVPTCFVSKDSGAREQEGVSGFFMVGGDA